MQMSEHIRQTTEAALNLAGADAYRRGDIEEAGRIDDALEWLHQQKAMPVPLDSPDGPGWWAYEDDKGMNRCVGWVYKNAFDYTMNSSRGMLVPSRLKGKWYRLTLPWESPAAQPKQGEG